MEVGNADVTVLLERPKLAPFRDAIIARIGEILGIAEDSVSFKAKTNEGLGEIGSGDAVAAMSVVGLVAAES